MHEAVLVRVRVGVRARVGDQVHEAVLVRVRGGVRARARVRVRVRRVRVRVRVRVRARARARVRVIGQVHEAVLAAARPVGLEGRVARAIGLMEALGVGPLLALLIDGGVELPLEVAELVRLLRLWDLHRRRVLVLLRL